jgi:uncharacterized membrane protein
MDKKFGIFVLLGLLLGGQLGVFFGPILKNPILGVALGALGGAFLGWFIAAAVLENQNSNKNK